MTPKLELLFPAGNLEKLKYAIAYGADAVYAGVPMFSLRARENQFTWEDLAVWAEYCHARGKKIYFTANIYAHNMKIKPFMAAFAKMEAMKPDAYIMSDPGLIDMVRTEYPNAEIHLSVQANNTNWAQIKFWQKVGIKRVILSRELSLREVQEIHAQCPDIELEFFVHGSICMAYSGRCLLSNYFSYRDPNQGTCSHSCRWEYKVFKRDVTHEDLYDSTGRPEEYIPLKGEFYLEEWERSGEMLPIDEDEYGTYIMNSRDICLLSYMQELADAGVVSFKIEGRSKTINYLAGVGRAYRGALDAVEAGKIYDADELGKEVFAISNRGYTPGFLVGNPGEKGIWFNKNGEIKEEEYLGIIREYDADRAMCRVEVKNQFQLWNLIKIIGPDRAFEFIVEKILDPKWESKESAHGGSFDIWMNCPQDPGEYALLRKKYDIDFRTNYTADEKKIAWMRADMV